MKTCVALAVLLAGTCILIGQSTSQTATATYSHGVIHLTLPHKLPHPGDGRLIIEVLNPEDEVLGRSERQILASVNGIWREDVKLVKALPAEDLVWQRLRYHFTYAGQREAALNETESISEILRMPVIRVLGQRTYLSGGAAASRIIVTDSHNDPGISSGIGPGSVHIDLEAPGQPSHTLFTGPLNRRGTVEAEFQLPTGLTGNSTLRYVVDTRIGSAEVTQPVRLEDKISILLSTEKPIYQPGQTIHARALALNRSDHHATANRDFTFWLEDSRGNKVFKKVTRTDQFGITSAEFRLADEVNLGTYHLHAQMDDPQTGATNRAEIALTVDRYVLPKFKVAFDFAAGDAQPRHGYRPGDHVKGIVRANYFFGKPVESAQVSIKATGMDVAQFDAASVSGKTDSEGAYHFDLTLPTYFAGKPLHQGAARVLLEATVTDSAGHAETRGEPVTVSESPLLVTAVPEGGTLIPNLENQVFLVCSYADGKPASVNVVVHASGAAEQRVSTNASGIGLIRLAAGVSGPLQVDATDDEGNKLSTSLPLTQRPGADQVLLRTEQAVYRAGDRIALKVLSTKKKGAVYVDVIKDGQTVLTRDLDLANGEADLTLAATPDLAGTLDVNAYLFGQDGRPISDHRLLFVQPADELKIEASADRAVYKPGDDAQIRFRVTNSRGEGVHAALGVQVVDEAVFALAEKQPGFAKVFFYLEQEAMKPRYEIHSIGMPEAVSVAPSLAARALFAATEMVNTNRFETEVGRNTTAAKYQEYMPRYYRRYQSSMEQLAASLNRLYQQQTDDLPELMARLTASNVPESRDAWGNTLRIEPTGNYYRVISPGPDRRFFTPDDLTALLAMRSGGSPAVLLVAIPQRIRIGGNVQFAAMVGQGKVRQFDAGALVNAGVVGGTGVVGGVLGGILGGVPVAAPPPPPAVKYEMAALSTAGLASSRINSEPAPHVRSYFPEALYINPEIITDRDGRASISVPLADSITTWRMALFASTARGALGSGASSLKVFQDFFVDLDLPVTLTQGDRVSIPVAVYNYSGASGNVDLKLQTEDWFRLVEDTSQKSLAVESGHVGGSQFTLEARRIGKFKLTLAARLHGGAGQADIVVREIEVIPNGREQNLVFNGRLENTVAHDVNFPAEAISEANRIFVRLYPGPLSQVIEGMDAILRMPFGCFEQTSSATYPNVLALDYMKRTKKLTPEVHTKAEGFIANGYQRLLTFEVPGGGFSWFGQAPANKILTAYGLMEFYDISQVYDVDPQVIARTQRWLAGQQQPDGSWKPDTSFINEGATNRYNSDMLRITGYIAWALENTGYRGQAVDKAREFIGNHMGEKTDAYTLAVLANFAADFAKDRAFTQQAISRLIDSRTEQGDQAWWTAEETGVYGRGASASIETTGLAVQALLKSGEDNATTRKALQYIATKKDASGTWGTTQATIMALRALLLSTAKGSADVTGTLEISLNGSTVQTLTLDETNNDLLHQFVLPNTAAAANKVAIRFAGKGGLAYQVVGRYFTPWTAKRGAEPLSIEVTYDRTRMAENDIATATAKVKNNLSKTANMIMIDLGIPPGFDLLSEDLQSYQEKTAKQRSGRLEKFNLTATQAILYFNSLDPGETVTLRYRLRAKYPIRARTLLSRVYEYYDPEVNSVARPVQLEVAKH